MAMTVLMKQTRQGDAGAVLSAGSTYTVTEALGAQLVGNGFATDVNGALQPDIDFDVSAKVNGVTGGIGLFAPSKPNWFAALLQSNWQDINVPLQQGCTTWPVYKTYIDAVNGNDSWDGSVPVWKGTTVGPKQTAVVGSWTGSKTSWYTGEILLFAAGQTHTLTATGASIGLGSRKHLGAYWLPTDTAAARPIIKSLNNAGAAASTVRACISASGTLTDISVSDLTIDVSDVPNRSGLSMYQTAAGQSINNITISNVVVIGGTITDSVGYGGIKIEYFGQSSTLTAYPESKNILIQHCAAIGYPGHGFALNGTLGAQLANGRWHGVDVINCVASGCGAGYDTHGFTSYSGGVLLDQTSGGWTLTSGTTYWMDIDSKFGRDIPSLEMLYMDSGSGTEVFKLLANTATPTTPAVGEFGFDATGGTGALRLYCNFGSALSATNRFSVAVRPTRGIRYIRCTAKGQLSAGRSGSQEGHGFAFDDFTSNCSVIECISSGNTGHGITINRGDNNQIVSTMVENNGFATIKGNFGWGNYAGKCHLSGAGYSDTVPGYKGALHLAAASHKAYGPNGTYAGALPAADTYSNIVASSYVSYSGSTAGVSLLLGATSNNAPPMVILDAEVAPGSAALTNGRAYMQGRATDSAGLPWHVRGTGPQA